ncbi:glycosyltransferase family 2 protein [Nocardioides baculatus]|uniref:Glycosyltransferase family 2 protein n=1 Tax=Nocardioides baculatus TaxID=2801337 RepID=A0ABS1LC67_9ACTN|nr:glycosyltransferase family 2 protein [Nocardioides baculatus]MBL0749132.1 glycosyltransferase family 2 protein [Nocardioides baculatus]
MPADTPRVSAIIPHYGDPALAQQVVADLHDQTSGHLLEVIVVDDCSPTEFPDQSEVVVVRRQDNGGFGAAVNSGAAVARGELLMVLNSDVRLSHDLVARLVEQATPLMPAVVGPRTTTPAGAEEPTGRRFPTTHHWVIERLVALQKFSEQGWYQRATGRVRPRDPHPRKVDWLQGSLLLLPANAFRAVDGFDERFYLYSEEVDLQRRLSDVGVSAWLLPTVSVEHEGGSSTDFDRSNEWLVRSRITYADKWGGLRSLRHAMRAVAVVNFATRSVQRVAGRPTAPRVAWRREMRAASTPPWPSPPDVEET